MSIGNLGPSVSIPALTRQLQANPDQAGMAVTAYVDSLRQFKADPLPPEPPTTSAWTLDPGETTLPTFTKG